MWCDKRVLRDFLRSGSVYFILEVGEIRKIGVSERALSLVCLKSETSAEFRWGFGEPSKK